MKTFWDVIFLLPLFYGLYFFTKAPLAGKYKAALWIDPLAGFALTIITLVYFYFAHIASTIISDQDLSPCGRLSKQMECYSLSEESCKGVWESSLGNCEEQLVEIRKARPSALVGPFMETCIGKNFDKVMHYNRKNLESDHCQSYFLKFDK